MNVEVRHFLLFTFSFSLFTVQFYQLSGGVAQLARAPALQAGGHRFDSVHLHQDGSVIVVMSSYKGYRIRLVACLCCQVASVS